MPRGGRYVDDPHGVVETFRARYEANLELMHPEMAAREAMAVLDGYLKGSKFIDLGSKSSTEKAYIRVDKRPEDLPIGDRRR